MADLSRRWPLEAALAPGVHGAAREDDPGVTITERRGLAVVQLMARKGRAGELADALGIGSEPGQASRAHGITALPLAPGQWLLVGAQARERALAEDINARAGDLGGAIEQSHGRTVLRLAGPHARDVLAKGCRLDLHPRAFAPGSCAQTPIAQVSALIHQADDIPSFDLYLASGYAASFLERLTTLAAEVGYRVAIEVVPST